MIEPVKAVNNLLLLVIFAALAEIQVKGDAWTKSGRREFFNAQL